MNHVILQINNLYKIYTKKGKTVLSNINFSLFEGQTLAIVGESGCGKSTLCKCIIGLEVPSSGSISYNNEEIGAKRTKQQKREIQIVFQNPIASLNPYKKMYDVLCEPLAIHKIQKSNWDIYVKDIIRQVGLTEEVLNKTSLQLSGGQCQRVNIARAIILKPKILICDEPISSLDISSQLQIIDLLSNLKKSYGLTYLFVSHNINIVKKMADHIMVIKDSYIIENKATAELFRNPESTHTKELLEANKFFSK